MAISEGQKLRVICNFLKKIHELDSEMSCNTAWMLALLGIAGDEGESPTALARELGVESSGPRRHADILGDRGRGGKEGLKLMTTEFDPHDLRRKRFVLTAAGRRFLAGI